MSGNMTMDQQQVFDEAFKYINKLTEFARNEQMIGHILALACNILMYQAYEESGMTSDNVISFQPDIVDVLNQIKGFKKEDEDKRDQEKIKEINKVLNDLNKEHPEVMAAMLETARERGDQHLFSPELRERMSKFNHLSAHEAMQSEEYWLECFGHVGYSKEEAKKLMKGIKDGMNA